ncbi:tRNA pseudouridine(55) synthase TruB [Aureibacter tunicatorum]|uniref:tRNA pseudouridine synthase B n=1 Tax=Aureibacter tunicatorum TaxID=866807 RepID=A0AAE3XMU7_9BACT|nr:tRNA pseudouridine(55) synthase TruB [Aureibacter tunicatorum]MDR6239852.1 tRNA pseudouridine55 synthase [Aureibacter tunicatorum]BDD04327.1 tRNA pseudouridine synthase B [Aureibacter tunicatorum]
MNFEEKDFSAGEVILIDKPKEWTSFDVVKKLRYLLKIKKIGHAGTLDPLATGLLILCTGKKTKSIESYQAQEKEYTGSMVIGKKTASHDLETEIEHVAEIDHISEEQILELTNKFTGVISQIPPQHSAIKVDGRRVYKSARKGKEVKIDPRDVTVSEFEITGINLPEIDFRIVCSKGTYIRSLVRDFGEELGVGAYMSSLRRTRIGEFKIEDAHQLDEYVQAYSNYISEVIDKNNTEEA